MSPKSKATQANFSKALNRFSKEDPTFKVRLDEESGQTIIGGMGELHLDIYIERMRREYKCEVDVGEPRVNYRECITAKASFDYLHKKQSGGSGQYGRVVGYVEPLSEEEMKEMASASGTESVENVVFENGIIGNAISPGYILACDKGFKEAAQAGGLIGHPGGGHARGVDGRRVHAVDSARWRSSWRR